MKLTFFAASLAIMTALSASSFAQDRGGVLNFARYEGSALVDPVYAERNPDIWMVGSLFDTLLRTGADGKTIEPGLAESYSVSEDGRIVTLMLREGVKFSDGTLMTGEDVVFSLNRGRNPDLGPWFGLLGSVDTVSAEGRTITLTLKQPDPTLLSILATFNSSIVSKAVFDAAPGTTDQEKAAAIFAAHTAGVGSGPFILAGFKQGASMDFTANPNYWRKGADGKPLPYLESVHFEIIPDDATRILKLQAGEVDVAEFIPFSRVEELKADANIRMELFPSTRIVYSPINTRATRADGTTNPLADVRVRQALNYATDKDALIGLVLQGSGKAMTSPLMAAATQLSNDMSPLYGYDIEKAKALIAEADLPAGTKISMTILSGSADDSTIFAALQQMWAPLGIVLVADQVDGPTRGAKNKSGEFDIHTYGWVNDVNDPSQVVGWLGYTPIRQAVGTGWESTEFNALFEASNAEVDPAARAEQYEQMQVIYAEAAPLLFMYETPFAVAVSKSVEGYVQTPLGNNVFDMAQVTR